ncbi:hypothetical protein [Mesorhizobium caraganae]|uniref:hypothetical protein n=1 Tax=Mesorhizobium caraganae TaxID=483206 RepID=UPI003ED0464D
MSHAALGPAVNKDGEALARPFVKCLLRLIRAQDFHGPCERKSDSGLLADFIITEELRRNIQTLRKLADTGAKLVGDVTAAIAYPEVARA